MYRADKHGLSNLLPALKRTGKPMIVATAGKPMPDGVSAKEGTLFFDYVPADLVCKKAQLVVCNGGSPTTNQALRNGVPVLGIAKNMDQFLNMRAIERFGAGVLVRSDRTGEAILRRALEALLHDASFSERASMLGRSPSALRMNAALTRSVSGLLSRSQ